MIRLFLDKASPTAALGSRKRGPYWSRWPRMSVSDGAESVQGLEDRQNARLVVSPGRHVGIDFRNAPSIVVAQPSKVTRLAGDHEPLGCVLEWLPQTRPVRRCNRRKMQLRTGAGEFRAQI